MPIVSGKEVSRHMTKTANDMCAQGRLRSALTLGNSSNLISLRTVFSS